MYALVNESSPMSPAAVVCVVLRLGRHRQEDSLCCQSSGDFKYINCRVLLFYKSRTVNPAKLKF